MLNQVTWYVLVVVGLAMISTIAMLGFRAFNCREADNAQQRHQRARSVVQYRPSERPVKPYNVFSTKELELLHTHILSQHDIDTITQSQKLPSSKPDKRCDNPLDMLRYVSPDCSICLNLFQASDSIRILACGHAYHGVCIDVWFTERSSRCPICKLDIRSSLGLERQRHTTVDVAEQPSAETPAPAATQPQQNMRPLSSRRQSRNGEIPAQHHTIDITPPPPALHL